MPAASTAISDHRAGGHSTGLRTVAVRFGPALLALGLALVATALGLQGNDLASAAYRSHIVRVYGVVVWDSGWYAGSLPFSYSVLTPLLGALVGVRALAVASATVAAWCFDRLVVHTMGERNVGSWYFAVSTLLAVAIGQLPYLLGMAVGLLAVLCLVNRHRAAGVALAALCVLCSPLAGAFLVMCCGVWAVSDRRLRWPMVAAAGAATVVIGATGLLFPGQGPFPFDWQDMLMIELCCAYVWSPLVRAPRAVKVAAVVYGLASLASWLVPNALGGNATRFAYSVGIPALAAVTTRKTVRQPLLAVTALVGFSVWQWASGGGVINSEHAAGSNAAAYYQPLIRQLDARDGTRPVRVEAVPTRDHWESRYLAPVVSLARGWDRQLDVADNPIFYTKGALDGASYKAWLDKEGVTWVALAAAPLDYAAVSEAALLRDHRVPGLTLVWHSATWELWRVDGSPGLTSGPGRLTSLAPNRLTLAASKPGNVLVRVHYTSYWDLAAGAACVLPAPGGWTEVRVRQKGTVRLEASLVGGVRAACKEG